MKPYQVLLAFALYPFICTLAFASSALQSQLYGKSVIIRGEAYKVVPRNESFSYLMPAPFFRIERVFRSVRGTITVSDTWATPRIGVIGYYRPANMDEIAAWHKIFD